MLVILILVIGCTSKDIKQLAKKVKECNLVGFQVTKWCANLSVTNVSSVVFLLLVFEYDHFLIQRLHRIEWLSWCTRFTWVCIQESILDSDHTCSSTTASTVALGTIGFPIYALVLVPTSNTLFRVTWTGRVVMYYVSLWIRKYSLYIQRQKKKKKEIMYESDIYIWVDIH